MAVKSYTLEAADLEVPLYETFYSRNLQMFLIS